MVTRRVAAALLCAGLAGMGTGVALAGQALPVSLGDFCSDEDHSGAPYDDPNGGPPITDGLSIIPFAGSIDGLPPAFSEGVFVLDANGPGGEPLTYEGPLDDQARFQGALPINQGGTYQVQGLDVRGEGPDGPFTASIPPADFPNGGAMPVTFDASAPCNATTVDPGVPATATAPTTEPTSTTTTEASAPPSTDVQVTLGDPPGESTFRQEFIIPIVLGGILIVVGVTIYYKTRERGRPRPPASTPLIATPPPPTDQCDWAAYYDDGTRRVPLRVASGDECCVYVVTMTSRVRHADLTARGQQAGDGTASPDERLRLFDHDIRFSGLDLVSWASARSGPAGRLDWMQTGPAASWPRSDDPHRPAGDYRPQAGAFEDEPDAALHAEYAEVNRLRITLESGCPDHQSSYTAQGRGVSGLEVSAECTNRAPGPECPVELDALTSSSSRVSGDLTYSLVAEAPGGGDEVEGQAGLDVREVSGTVVHGSHVDSHDHLSRPRPTFTGEHTGGAGPAVTSADVFSMDVDNVALHDVGVLVPVRTWPTTDAVSADVYVDFQHDISVDAAMTRTTCAAPGAGCCGHSSCRCAPKLEVVFSGGAAHIHCDGSTYAIGRSGFGAQLGLALGAEVPWELT